MNINIYLRENFNKSISSNVFTAPEIPEKKLNNAVSSFKFSGNPNAVIVLFDNTLFGSAKEGLLLTGEQIIFRPMFGDPIPTNFEDVDKFEYVELITDAEKGKKEIYLSIIKKDGSKVDVKDLTDCNYKKLQQVLAEVVSAEIEFKEEIQIVPVEDMDPQLKESYIKIVINMAYDNDGEVDSKEFAEILMLMTRLDFNTESRMILRAYLTTIENQVSTESLLESMDELCPDGQERSLHVSLVKDLINIHLCTGNSSVENFQFLKKHRSILRVTDSEIDLAEEAIKVDLQLIREDVTDTQMAKLVKSLSAKAAAVGVPLAALYLSGSVIGLSAAGITSGLATLGMGGILGMSGMVTGIGVVVLVGVGAYSGMRKFTGVDEADKSKRRELILTEVVKQTQKTISQLMQDINYVTGRLNSLITSDDLKGDKIRALGRLLQQMTSAGTVLNERTDIAQGGISRIHCAQYLDKTKLGELTREPTKKIYYDYIFENYEEITLEVKSVDGGPIRNETKFKIKPELNSRQLEDLAEAFEIIGYYKLTDSMMGKVNSIKDKIFG